LEREIDRQRRAAAASAMGGGAASFGREMEVGGELHGAVERDDLAFYRPEARGEAAGRWLAQASSQELSNGCRCAAWHGTGCRGSGRGKDGDVKAPYELQVE
jgi:hypothetical protein